MTAQIRIRRNGAIVYQESSTFTSMAKAKSWAKRRESDSEDLGIEPTRDPVTVSKVMRRYVTEVAATPAGIDRTKKWAFEAMIKRQPWQKLALADTASSDIVGYLQDRSGDGAAPSAVGQDPNYLTLVADSARVAWSMRILRESADKVELPTPQWMRRQLEAWIRDV